MSESIPSDSKTVSIWYLARFARPYAGLILWSLLFLVAGRVASSLDPIWLKKIVDGVATPNRDLAALKGIVITYLSLKVASFIFDLLRDLIFSPAESGVALVLSRRLFAHLLTLPVSFHTEQKIGGISRKITRGGRSVTFLMDILVLQILPTFFELVFVTFLLFKLYRPEYALTTFGTVVIYTVFTVWATEKRQKYRIGANQADDEVSSLEVDALTNIETVKYFNNEQLLNRQYLPSTKKRFDLSTASNQLFAVVAAGQAAILTTGVGIIIVMAIRQTLAGQLTVGDLVLLTTYIVRLSAPVSVLGFVYRSLKDGIADLDGMARIMHEPVTVSEPTHPQSVENPRGEVRFDQVSFSYNSGRQVLKDIAIEVPPGHRIAFVGPSGVGKSTIVKLLFRFFDPTSGKICIDGVDLRYLSKEERRRMFAIVPQEPALFNTTIGENIRFGKPDATQEEVERAAKLASIDHFVQSLPEKYDSLVGERGVKLSGGEKQRVAIARAIIRDPKVLVFDEATSSLDSRSERAIQEALHAISEGRTTIAVAHRLSTIADSDQIYVLDKGGLAEQGTHAELLDKKGLYARLWEIQAHEKRDSSSAPDLIELPLASSPS